jgi:hypothetical protein
VDALNPDADLLQLPDVLQCYVGSCTAMLQHLSHEQPHTTSAQAPFALILLCKKQSCTYLSSGRAKSLASGHPSARAPEHEVGELKMVRWRWYLTAQAYPQTDFG